MDVFADFHRKIRDGFEELDFSIQLQARRKMRKSNIKRFEEAIALALQNCSEKIDEGQLQFVRAFRNIDINEQKLQDRSSIDRKESKENLGKSARKNKFIFFNESSQNQFLQAKVKTKILKLDFDQEQREKGANKGRYDGKVERKKLTLFEDEKKEKMITNLKINITEISNKSFEKTLLGPEKKTSNFKIRQKSTIRQRIHTDLINEETMESNLAYLRKIREKSETSKRSYWKQDSPQKYEHSQLELGKKKVNVMERKSQNRLKSQALDSNHSIRIKNLKMSKKRSAYKRDTAFKPPSFNLCTLMKSNEIFYNNLPKKY